MSKIRLLSFMNITPSDLMQWSWVYGDYDNWVKSFVKLHFHFLELTSDPSNFVVNTVVIQYCVYYEI